MIGGSKPVVVAVSGTTIANYNTAINAAITAALAASGYIPGSIVVGAMSQTQDTQVFTYAGQISYLVAIAV